MNVKELAAYRERLARQAARVSEAQGIMEARKQRAQGLMVRVGKGHRTIVTQGFQRGVNGSATGIKERGWNGVPQSMPSDVYPSRVKVVKRRDVTAPTTTVAKSELAAPFAESTIPFIADVRASDIQGRAARPEKSERIMKDALKGYSNRV